jgi:hypothetical protein
MLKIMAKLLVRILLPAARNTVLRVAVDAGLHR